MPFTERLVGRALRAGNVCGGRASSSLPGDVGTPGRPFPYCTYEELGGPPAERTRLGQGHRVQVTTWAETQSEAWVQAELARRVLHELEGEAVESGTAYVHAVDDEQGIFRNPDPPTGRERYQFTVVLYTSTIPS